MANVSKMKLASRTGRTYYGETQPWHDPPAGAPQLEPVFCSAPLRRGVSFQPLWRGTSCPWTALISVVVDEWCSAVQAQAVATTAVNRRRRHRKRRAVLRIALVPVWKIVLLSVVVAFSAGTLLVVERM